MDIIDSHMHIGFDCNKYYYEEKDFYAYLKEIKDSKIKYFIPSVNPKITLFICPKDCSNNCKELETKNEKVCPVECLDRDRHRVRIVDGLNGNLIAYCTKCQEKIYEGPDPFRKYNLMLIELCKATNIALPNLVLTISNATINDEVKFYEENFKNLFLGYKIHQTTNMRSIDSIDFINSNRTILVHSDLHQYDSINNILSFNDKYKGNIVVAHSYLIQNYRLIKNKDNLYFDICPTDNFKKYNELIPHNKEFDKCDNMYNASINYLPLDRLLFGTDWPYGNVEKNIKEVEDSVIDEEIKTKILSLNVAKAYHL